MPILHSVFLLFLDKNISNSIHSSFIVLKMAFYCANICKNQPAVVVWLLHVIYAAADNGLNKLLSFWRVVDFCVVFCFVLRTNSVGVVTCDGDSHFLLLLCSNATQPGVLLLLLLPET